MMMLLIVREDTTVGQRTEEDTKAHYLQNVIIIQSNPVRHMWKEVSVSC